MRKAIKAFMLCLAGTASILPVSTNAGPADFFGYCMDGCWEVGAEALWWKPCIQSFDYAVIENNSTATLVTQASIESVKADYNWGFRIFTGYRSECDCYFLRLGWTYLRASDSSSVFAEQGQTLEPIFSTTAVTQPRNTAPYQSAFATQRIYYNNINLRAGYYLHTGCCIDFYAYGGLRYVDIDQSRRVKGILIFNDDVPTVGNERSTFDGVGFELGFGGEYRIGCGFDLVGHLGAVGLLGHQRLHADAFFPGVDGRAPVAANINRPSSTTCVPGVELRFGLSYAYECGCWEFVGEVGYELDYYYRIYSVVDRATQTDETDFASQCINVGFGGPYIGLSVCF